MNVIEFGVCNPERVELVGRDSNVKMVRPIQGRENNMIGNLLFHGFHPRLLKGLTPIGVNNCKHSLHQINDPVRIEPLNNPRCNLG